MQVFKKDLIKGLLSFANEEMLPSITDKALQMGLYMIMQVVARSPEVMEKWLDTPVVNLLLGADGNIYDLDVIKASLTATMQRYGSFMLSVPAIPLILKHDVTMSLGIADLEALIRHIEVASNGS